MGKGTLFFLLALVGVLSCLWFARQRENAHGGPGLGEFPLLPTLAVERVRRVRIEHLERGFQMAWIHIKRHITPV